jgi:hypothetical protein
LYQQNETTHTMTTTAKNIVKKLLQAEAIHNATSYDMQIDAFNAIVELKRSLMHEIIDMTGEAFDKGDITVQEDIMLNKLTGAITMLDVKSNF